MFGYSIKIMMLHDVYDVVVKIILSNYYFPEEVKYIVFIIRELCFTSTNVNIPYFQLIYI
jgi:hypothetical protein